VVAVTAALREHAADRVAGRERAREGGVEFFLRVTRPRLTAAARLARGLGTFRADLLIRVVGVSLFHLLDSLSAAIRSP
jgi:hypothetical protein